MMLSSSLAAAHRAAAGVHGVACAYRRGAVAVSLTALRGATRYEAEDEQGVLTTFVTVDFLVLREDLALSGAQLTPLRGDRIECDGAVFEVLPLGDQCFSVDPTGTKLRIHTKRVT